MVLELHPDIIVGFGIDNKSNSYEIFQQADIPVVYNGDWTEETPLGKAEWIKFSALFDSCTQLFFSILTTTDFLDLLRRTSALSSITFTDVT